MGKERNDKALLKWCDSQHEFVLGSLRQATEHDVNILVNITKQRGVQVLRDV